MGTYVPPSSKVPPPTIPFCQRAYGSLRQAMGRCRPILPSHQDVGRFLVARLGGPSRLPILRPSNRSRGNKDGTLPSTGAPRQAAGLGRVGPLVALPADGMIGTWK